MRLISLTEFAVRLRVRLIDSKEPVVWFLGAGCSISSGIPGAGGLVAKWLGELHGMQGPGARPLAEWAAKEFKTYDPERPARAYAEIFERRHFTASERQQEIERICAKGEAGYGYATFAQIITNGNFGGYSNTILTTNFDDLVAESVYLYGEFGIRPQIITHEAVARYARISSRRPTIIKFHGDAHLSPKNLSGETSLIDEEVADHLYPFMRDSAIIFIGYGGYDVSINQFLKRCPRPELSPPVFWIGQEEPSEEMSVWLEERDAVRVDHIDFDRAMHILRGEFKIDHPAEDRWTRASRRYFEVAAGFEREIAGEPNPELKDALAQVSADALGSLPDEWAWVTRAYQKEGASPDEADDLYSSGIAAFPRSAPLLGNYALFLENVRKDPDAAEALYKRAIDADPSDANSLGNYAVFLENVRKDPDAAEALYQRAIDADPRHANSLGNYAAFLNSARKDPDAAEALFKRAIDAASDDVDSAKHFSARLTALRAKKSKRAKR